MTPDDRLAAFVVLALMITFAVVMTIAAHQILGIIRDRPVVVRHLGTKRLIVVRSPNPRGLPRRHGPRNPKRVVHRD